MKKGVTLLLAIFISTLALSLGLGIFTVIYGELGISGTSKASLLALYAADSGIECSLYWDIKQHSFSTTTVNQINCAGINNISVGGSDAPMIFNLSLANNTCSSVTVYKSDTGVTTIDSLGSNISCGGSSSRTVQRGLEVIY